MERRSHAAGESINCGAAKLFDEVERQHPYSTWATQAQLMSAYSYYLIDSYDDAIPALERFIDLHPGNRGAAYAYYLRALCYYEQIADVSRDQGNTEEAQRALSDVIARFPNTPYARDATLKLDLVRDHLAKPRHACLRLQHDRSVQGFHRRWRRFLPAESTSVRAGSDAEARCALIGTRQSRQGRCAS